MKTKLLLMLLVALGLVAPAAQANMLLNPSFEDGIFSSDGTPTYWVHYYTSYDPVHSWVDDSAEAHSGSKYMKMYNWLAFNTTWSSSAWLGQEVPGVKEGKDYTFSVWAKNGAEGLTHEAAVEIEWRDSLDDWISSDSIYLLFTDSDWTEVDFGAFTAPEGAAAATMWLAAPVGNYLNPICYDDAIMLGPDPNVHAGSDMVSWDGETVSLTGNVSLPGGYSTIAWIADPGYCAVITGGDTLTPTVQVNPIIESGPATIVNHSFENGLTGWTTVSGEGHGTWNGVGADTADPNYLKVYITPTDGRMCSYVNGVSDGIGTLSQVLANTLAADTTYTLMVDVVNDGYYEENVDYIVQLLAGETVLAEDNNGHSLPKSSSGNWETSIVTYNSGGAPAELGEPLEIHLIAEAGTSEMTFDNVRLTANPPFGAYVPDILPITMTLEIDGDKYDTMKIDAYPDACAAKLGAGLREATDLVDDDCITNLADLDEMLKTWSDHNALTAPITKPMPPDNPQNLYSINFYYLSSEGYPGGYWPEDHLQYITIEEDEFAGMGDWLTNAWSNVEVPWAEFVPTPIEGTSNKETPVTFTLLEKRNGWAIDVDNPIQPDATAEMMNAGVYGTEDGDQGHEDLENNWINILVEDIPMATYDVIVYVTAHIEDVLYEWDSDQTGKFVFNGVEQDVIFAMPPFDGTFTRITDSVTPGNYLLFEDVTGTSFTIQMWGNGWNHVAITGLQFGGPDPFAPSPVNREYVYPDSELELSWTNFDPNIPSDPVYVDVWFGTDPNDYNDYNKIVDATTPAGEDANSVTVDASELGTYYWQVDSYIYGDPTVVDYSKTDANDLPIFERSLTFTVVTDVPVSVEAGSDVVTWSGQEVQLDASFDDDGVPAFTWSADPADGVVFNPNEFVEDPEVTIIAVGGDPNVITLTFSADDGLNSDEDTITIDVYDTACLAAIGLGMTELDTGDVDADCDTDLKDFAAIAEEWLVYSELTGPVVKP